MDPSTCWAPTSRIRSCSGRQRPRGGSGGPPSAQRSASRRSAAWSSACSPGLYTGVFVIGSFLAGLGGALVTPVKTIVPGMDVEIIVEAFIVVVIGGLGSFWGTFLGSIVYGQVLSFGILIFPRFSIFSVFALMAVVLIVRPWGLLGRPLR